MKSYKLGFLYSDGEAIIKKGETGNCLFVIQEGRVEVLDETDGAEKRIAVLHEADFFGEMGLFEKDVHSCTVRALGSAKVLTIDKKNFYNMIAKDPTIAYKLLEKMSKRLRDTNRMVR